MLGQQDLLNPSLAQLPGEHTRRQIHATQCYIQVKYAKLYNNPFCLELGTYLWLRDLEHISGTDSYLLRDSRYRKINHKVRPKSLMSDVKLQYLNRPTYLLKYYDNGR